MIGEVEIVYISVTPNTREGGWGLIDGYPTKIDVLIFFLREYKLAFQLLCNPSVLLSSKSELMFAGIGAVLLVLSSYSHWGRIVSL